MIQLLPKTIGLINVNHPPKYIPWDSYQYMYCHNVKPWRWSSMQTSRIPFPFLLFFTGPSHKLSNHICLVIHFIISLYNLQDKHTIDQKNSRMMHLSFLTKSIYEKVLPVWSSSYKKNSPKDNFVPSFP